MNLPKSLFGIYKDIRPVCNQAIKVIKQGNTFLSCFEKDLIPFPDNSSQLIILQGPNPVFGSHVHGHLYLPLKVLFEAMTADKLPEHYEESIFKECCQQSWSVLALVAPVNLMWLQPPNRHQPFLNACLSFWDQWNTLGACYTIGMNYGQLLWELPTTLKHILARHNISPDLLNAPQSSEAIKALINKVLSSIS